MPISSDTRTRGSHLADSRSGAKAVPALPDQDKYLPLPRIEPVMLRLLTVTSLFLLSSARIGGDDYFYDPCRGRYVGDGYYNLGGEKPYNRQAELVCDFNKARIYDRVTDIAWIKLDRYGSCRGAGPIPGRPTVITHYGRSLLNLPYHDERDHGVYRCFGTVDSGYHSFGRRRVVYMDVKFRPGADYRYDY